MKDTSGAELIALAGVTAVKISECLDMEELIAFLEFLGLLRHNLEVIKVRRLIKKFDEKKDEKKEEKKEKQKEKESGVKDKPQSDNDNKNNDGQQK